MRVKNLGGTSLVILHAVFTSSKEWGGGGDSGLPLHLPNGALAARVRACNSEI